MKKFSFDFVWISIFIPALLLQSCIDNKYSLDNLPDKLLIMGDSIVLPLGKSDSLKIGQFIADQKFESLENRNGVIYLNKKDSFDIALPNAEELRVKDIHQEDTVVSKITGAPVNVNIPVTNTITLTSSDSSVNMINTGKVVERLDYVKVKSGSNYARMSLTFKLQDISFINGDGSVSFNVTMPEGLEIVPDNGQITNRQYQITFSSISQLPATRSFTIKSLTTYNRNKLVFQYSSTTTINAGSTIRYTSTKPGLNVSLAATNLYADYIVGKINYSNTVVGPEANIANLFTLFNSQAEVRNNYNSAFYLTTQSNVGIPINLTLKTTAFKNGTNVKADLTPLKIIGANSSNPVKTNNFILSNLQPTTNLNDTVWKSFDLKGYLNVLPDKLTSKIDYQTTPGTGTLEIPHYIPSGAFAKVLYKFVLPLAYANDFLPIYTDTLADVLNKDIRKYLFETGSVTFTGNVVTNIPLDGEIKLSILSSDLHEAPVNVKSSQIITAAIGGQTKTTPFTFAITADDMKNMLSPKDLAISFKMSMNNDVSKLSVKGSSFIFLEKIRLTKKGGATIH
jgi:hypothetical protein